MRRHKPLSARVSREKVTSLLGTERRDGGHLLKGVHITAGECFHRNVNGRTMTCLKEQSKSSTNVRWEYGQVLCQSVTAGNVGRSTAHGPRQGVSQRREPACVLVKMNVIQPVQNVERVGHPMQKIKSCLSRQSTTFPARRHSISD